MHSLRHAGEVVYTCFWLTPTPLAAHTPAPFLCRRLHGCHLKWVCQANTDVSCAHRACPRACACLRTSMSRNTSRSLAAWVKKGCSAIPVLACAVTALVQTASGATRLISFSLVIRTRTHTHTQDAQCACEPSRPSATLFSVFTCFRLSLECIFLCTHTPSPSHTARPKWIPTYRENKFEDGREHLAKWWSLSLLPLCVCS